MAGLDIHLGHINGDLSVVGFREGSPFGVAVLDIDPATERIRSIYVVANPDKLTRVTDRPPHR